MRNAELMGRHVAGAAAGLAAAIWVAQWLHSGVTHGRTEVNEKRLYLGATWMDSGQFLALAFLLLVPGVLVVARRAGAEDRRVRGLAAVVIACLVVSAVTTFLQFGLFEWGSYEQSFETAGRLVYWAGILQAVVSAGLLTLALAAFGIVAARRGGLPYTLVAVLCVGSMATVFLAGPLPPVPAAAWLAFGLWLLLRGRAQAS